MNSLLHKSNVRCNAWIILKPPHHYLILDWIRGKSLRIALDAYLIQDDGLTPVWDAQAIQGSPQYWTPLNASWLARVHKTVLNEIFKAHALHGVSSVKLLAHYVHHTDCEPLTAVNHYKASPYVGRPPKRVSKLPDVL